MSDIGKVFSIVLDDVEKKFKERIEQTYKECLREIDAEFSKLIEELKSKEREYKSIYEREERNLRDTYDNMLRVEKSKLTDSMIEKVFEEALNKIAKMPRDESYCNLLEDLIIECLKYIDSKRVLVEASKNDAEVIDKIAEKVSRETGREIIVRRKDLESVGGVIVSNPEKSVVVDNTFEARLKRIRPVLRAKIYKIMFRGG